jgi:hypothetical protein
MFIVIIKKNIKIFIFFIFFKMSRAKTSISDLPIDIINKISEIVDHPLYLLNHELYNNLDKKVLVIGKSDEGKVRYANHKTLEITKDVDEIIINSIYKYKKIILKEGVKKLVINVDIGNELYTCQSLCYVSLPNSLIEIFMKHWYPIFPYDFPKNLKKLTAVGLINLIIQNDILIRPKEDLENKNSALYRATENYFVIPENLKYLNYSVWGKYVLDGVKYNIIFNDNLRYLTLDYFPEKLYVCNLTLNDIISKRRWSNLSFRNSRLRTLINLSYQLQKG